MLCQCGCVHYHKKVSVMPEMSVWGRPRELGDALSSGKWDFTFFERERLEDWLELFGGMEMVG